MLSTLRSKLILAFLVVALLPLGVLIYLNDQATRQVLNKEANESLSAAAEQTAADIDSFMRTTASTLRAQSQLPSLTEYLEVDPDSRSGSPQEAAVFTLLRSLSRSDQEIQPYVSSYALLDLRGVNVADTFTPDIGQDFSQRDYFLAALDPALDLAYISPVEDFLPGTTSASIYFSAPVRNTQGTIVGVLRVRYKADILQKIVAQADGRAGEEAYGVLFDNQYHVRLAHGREAEFKDLLFQPVVPMDPAAADTLRAERRLPDNVTTSTNLPDLEAALRNPGTRNFTSRVTGETDEQNAIAVAPVNSQPWQIVFAQPRSVFLNPVESFTRNTLIGMGAASILIILAAIATANLLAAPITRLTITAEQISAGDLTAVANVQDGGEIGRLASAFNEMTGQLRNNLASLERRVGERTRALETSSQVSRRLSTLTDQKHLFQAVVDEVRRAFDYYHAQIFLVDADGEYAVMAAGTGEAGQAMLARGHKLAIGRGVVGTAAARNEIMLVADVGEDTAWLPNPLLPETRGELAVPIALGNLVVGVLDVQHKVSGALSQADADLLRSIADQVAVAQQNAGLYEQVQNSLAETASQYAVSRRLAAAVELNEMVASVADELRTPEINRIMLMIFDYSADGKVDGMTVAATWHSGRGTTPNAIGTQYPREIFTAIRLIFEREPLFFNDVQDDPRIDRNTQIILRRLKIRAMVGLPLWIGARQLGALLMQADEPHHFTEREIKYYPALISQFAVAVENRRLFDETQKRAEQLATLNRITETVASVLDLRQALSKVARELVTLFKARNSGITMLNDERSIMIVVADYSADPADTSAVGIELPIAGNPSSEYVVYNRRALIINEPKADPLTAPIHQLMKDRNTECLMIVPLLSRGEVIGTIGLDLTDPRRKFNTAELNLAETIAGQIANAVENARLYTAAQQELLERKRIAGELQTVAEVSTTVSTVLESGRLLQSVVDLTKDRFALYHVHIYLLDEDGEYLVLAAGAGEIGHKLVASGRRIALDQEQSLVARAARTRQGVVSNDVRLTPDFLPNPLLPDTRSELATPMIAGNKLIGIFDIQSSQVNRFTTADVRTHTMLAGQIAVALQNAQLYAEQSATVARLRELDQLKSSFLASMSHELRTPLNSIIGFTEVILAGIDGEIPQDAQEDLQIIHDNGTHLLGLINDILDMAKIESGRMELRREDFSLPELLQEAVNMTNTLAQKKGLYLRLESSPPVLVNGDRQRVRQVLLNLISNGLKFTEHGGVTIRALLAPSGQQAIVAVKDSGIGIQQEDMGKVFEEFRQIDNATTRKAGGTGLGLPISKRLIEMHGEHLWGESAGIPGDGTTFLFTIALAESTEVIHG